MCKRLLGTDFGSYSFDSSLKKVTVVGVEGFYT